MGEGLFIDLPHTLKSGGVSSSSLLATGLGADGRLWTLQWNTALRKNVPPSDGSPLCKHPSTPQSSSRR